MAKTKFLTFDGLTHPVALEDARPLIPLIGSVLHSWPFSSGIEPSARPFLTIRPAPEQDERWSLEHSEAHPEDNRTWDSINTIVDLIAEISWERLRSEPDLLCLHAAAVEFGSKLVVMPNSRRAGKSTLAVALSHLGHRLWTDDVLPVRFDAIRSQPVGLAGGIAPRLRLPVPDSFSRQLRNWITQDPGPSNRQYKFLVQASVAAAGSDRPLGAVVVLNRQDSPTTPRLEPLLEEEALATLIQQNFARAAHSAQILASFRQLIEGRPVFQLVYSSAEEAALYLSSHPALQNLSDPAPIAPSKASQKLSRLRVEQDPRPSFYPDMSYQQAPGVTETTVGQDFFLADTNGHAIHRLNPGSVAIWRLLSEPATLEELTTLIEALFDDVSPDQARSDTEAVLRRLVEANLVIQTHGLGDDADNA